MDDMEALFGLTSKKKKKSKKKKESSKGTKKTSKKAKGSSSKTEEEEGGEPQAEAKTSSSASSLQSRLSPYSYDELLDRISDRLRDNNPELTEKRAYVMKPPQLLRGGPKKTIWVNFYEICRMMRRNPDHVMQFVLAELGAEGSIDGSNRLVIRGKFVSKYVESLLRKYIVEYVTCSMCRSPNTELTRDPNTRLYFVHCKDCESTRSVAPIRASYHAQTRKDRILSRK
jgi:translation initiation factor 2 subunit 2